MNLTVSYVQVKANEDNNIVIFLSHVVYMSVCMQMRITTLYSVSHVIYMSVGNLSA